MRFNGLNHPVSKFSIIRNQDRLRGLERAAEVRDRAQARGGNGRGNAFGRRAQLETSGDHSANVRLLVDAHNVLRKTGPDRAD